MVRATFISVEIIKHKHPGALGKKSLVNI